MNDSRKDWQRIPRRVVLTGTALALGATAVVTAVSQSPAQQKISQADAKYQGTPKGDQRCDVPASTSNRRMHANLLKGTLARAAGASCLPRRHSFLFLVA